MVVSGAVVADKRNGYEQHRVQCSVRVKPANGARIPRKSTRCVALRGCSVAWVSAVWVSTSGLGSIGRCRVLASEMGLDLDDDDGRR